MTTRNQIAASIWPNLAADRPTPSEQPRSTNALANSMWPSLAPKKQPPPHILLIRQLLKETTAALKAERLAGKR
jgi:hypothetical protein